MFNPCLLLNSSVSHPRLIKLFNVEMFENTEKYKLKSFKKQLKSLVISFPTDNGQCNLVHFLMIISNIYTVFSVCQALFLAFYICAME